MRVTGQANVVAHILIKLHDNGAMSVEGNIGDTDMALAMLGGALDAVKSRAARDAPALVLPPSYTGAVKPDEQRFPIVAEADNASDAPHSAAKADAKGLDWLRP